MLDIAYIRDNPDKVRNSIRRRGLKIDLDELLRLDKQRIAAQQKAESLRTQLKITSKPTREQQQKLQAIKTEFDQANQSFDQTSKQYQALIESLPNLIAEGTPDGGEEANRVECESGKKPQFDFEPLDHLKLNDKLELFDFEAGARVAGSKFYFGRDKLVRLEMAVTALAVDIIRQAGFELVSVPMLVNERVSTSTGFAPRGDEDQIYKVEDEDLHLIATSEIPLTGMYADQIIDLEKPKYLAGISTCFRREAGAYGKFSKGLYRVHQFNKLELYIYCKPEQSDQMLQKILQIEEQICQALEIPYRVVRIATGDLSAPAYEKYDIEYWTPAENTYRELTSCSNCTDYQARRLNIRYRGSDGKLKIAHTLNGTAITSSRTLIAILENHQTKAGDVILPSQLYNYYGGDKL